MSTFSVQATISAIDKASPAIRAVRKSMLGLAQDSVKVNAAFKTMANLKPFGSSGMNGFGSDAKRAAAGVAAIAASLNTASRAAGGLSAQLAKINAQLGRQQKFNSGGGLGVKKNAKYHVYSGHGAYTPHDMHPSSIIRNRIEKGLEDTGNLSHQRALGDAQGIQKTDMKTLEDMASKYGKQYGNFTTATGLELARAVRNNLGDIPHTLEALPTALQGLSTMISRDPKGGVEKAGHAIENATRALEILGLANTSENFKEGMQKSFQVANTFGKQFDFDKLRQLATLTRGAGLNFSKDWLFTHGAAIGQELGGAQGGAALSALNNAAIKGIMTPRSFKQFEELGYINEDKVIRGPNGGFKGLRPGAMKSGDLFLENPTEWVKKLKQDVSDAHFKKTGERLTDKKATAETASMFSNMRADQIVGIIGNQYDRLQKEYKNIKGAKGTDAGEEIIKTSASAANSALGERISNKFSEILDPLNQPLANLSNYLRNLLDNGSKGGQVAAGIGGAGVVAGGAILKHVYENPGQSALTAAIGLNTAAVTANTAAQGIGGLGVGKGKGAARGLLRSGARFTGIVGAAVVAAEVMDHYADKNPENSATAVRNRRLADGRAKKQAEWREFEKRNDPSAGENARISAQLAKMKSDMAALVTKNTEDRTKKDANYGREGERGLAMMNLAQPIQAAHEAGAAKIGSSIGESAGKLASSGTQFGSNATGPIVGSANTWGATAAAYIARAAANIKITTTGSPSTGTNSSGGMDSP